MTLRVPTAKAASVGMRKLAEGALVKRALETLKGRARVKRTMWSRRAQEYEAKINSGDIVAIAEVVRDLFRSERSPSSPIRSVSSTRPRSTGCRARSLPCSASPRPRRSRRSRPRSPRVRAAARPSRPKSWSRTRRRKRLLDAESNSEARRRRRAFCVLRVCGGLLACPEFVAGMFGSDPAKWFVALRNFASGTAKISRSSHIVASIVGDRRAIGRSADGGLRLKTGRFFACLAMVGAGAIAGTLSGGYTNAARSPDAIPPGSRSTSAPPWRRRRPKRRPNTPIQYHRRRHDVDRALRPSPCRPAPSRQPSRPACRR